MQDRVFKFISIAVLAAATVFLFADRVLAAEIFLSAKSSEIRTGQPFEVEVFLNAGNDSINALEGKIIFPQDLLELKTANDGNSIINFWVEQPKAGASGQAAFSGIIPGGYNGGNGKIFSLAFLAKKVGRGVISIGNARALQNDGAGTEAGLAVAVQNFVVNDEAPVTPEAAAREDREPPEGFLPQIASDPSVFDGKWFLVFATQDKGSGIDHYSVCEGNEKCIVAESPYLLKDQGLRGDIVVTAVDKSGNERSETVSTRHGQRWYEKYVFSVALASAACLIGLFTILLGVKRKTRR